MTNSWQNKGSFLFGTTDVFTAYGIKLAEDIMHPFNAVNDYAQGASFTDNGFIV